MGSFSFMTSSFSEISILSCYEEIEILWFIISEISRQHVLTWCLENAFELVELDPVENCDIEDGK